jgi:hypothetical protein
MRSWVFVVLVACGGSSKPAPVTPPPPVAAKPVPPPKVEPAKTPVKANPDDCANMTCAIAIIDDFSKQMCACKDKACAEGVTEKLQTWAENISNKPELKDIKPTDDQQEQMQAIVQRYSDCMIKAMGGGESTKPTTGLGGGLKF